MEKDNSLAEFKRGYEDLKKKYDLPDFMKLGEDFDIEKVADKETSFPLRDIRRMIAEKISAYLHLFEIFMNPANPPMFIFSMLKNANEGDMDMIKLIYKDIAKMELELLKLDTIYNEKKEAEFIICTAKVWDKLKMDISKLLEKFDKSVEEGNSVSKRGYFG